MRFIIMHKTNPHWEAGGIPTPDLVRRVGALLGELAKAGVLVAGEGLRASSTGVRLKFSQGTRTVITGPFTGDHELPVSFSIVRARSLDDAVEWASRQAEVLGDVEMDIRPVTEPWDIGVRSRPADLTTCRYMVLRKATAATEAGEPPSATERSELSRLIEEAMREGLHIETTSMRPSSRGRRYLNSRNGVTMYDGPFVESKELLGGYVVVSAESLDDVDQWARRYIRVVDAAEVDVRELE